MYICVGLDVVVFCFLFSLVLILSHLLTSDDDVQLSIIMFPSVFIIPVLFSLWSIIFFCLLKLYSVNYPVYILLVKEDIVRYFASCLLTNTIYGKLQF